jgi:biopolymer transport protein ExbD
MNRYRTKVDEEVQAIDLTPMLDVVFIMLIFFIVTASFVKDTGKEITRPDSTTAEDAPRASLLIAVTKENEIWMDNQRIDPSVLRLAIERMRVENPKGAIAIQADEHSSIKFVVEIANAARQAGITDVVVSTRKK